MTVNNVKVDLANDCPGHWTPAVGAMQQWLTTARRHAAPRGRPVSLSVRIVGESESAQLNRDFRGKDKPTNVLSFSCELPAEIAEQLDRVPLGDLVICAPLVESEAREQGKTREAHWAHLLTHGFLHLHGFEHEENADAEHMESVEIAVLHELGFPDPYQIN